VRRRVHAEAAAFDSLLEALQAPGVLVETRQEPEEEDSMNEFEEIDLTGQAPAGICAECAKHGRRHLPMQTVIVHCAHNLRGAYRVLERPWRVIPGVEASAFAELVLRGLTAGELRVDLQRELTRLLEDQARNATKH
jgi:hypothetical protein